LPARLNADEKNAGPGGARFSVAMTVEDKFSRDPKTVFAPETPAVYAVYRVVATGPTKVKAVFWADGVEGLETKTKLLEKAVSIPGKGEFMGAIQAQKPANGWPAGSYHVDLFIGDTLSKTLAYKVVKGPVSP
ncbi:MAG: hypothetical protein WCC53_04805, partial [Thermoanaerobaculia bacterium]